jgi:glyoxylase-like metal-dependent hydrolase (beta-lactamase superfamily II)
MTLDGTNTWVLRAPGAEAAVVVDPGPLDEGHLAAVAAHGPIATILLTHGHPDHIDGLDRLVELTGAAVRRPADGEVREAGLTIRPFATPGHTADSVCYSARAGAEPPVVLTGDTILGRGTTIVAHPDGDLGDYLVSLARLSDLDGLAVLPGHGPALADCGAAARFYLEHRRQRLAQVRAAVAAGARTPVDVVAAVYADVDRSLWPAAEWTVRAQLAYLAREPGGDPAGEFDSPPAGLDQP